MDKIKMEYKFLCHSEKPTKVLENENMDYQNKFDFDFSNLMRSVGPVKQLIKFVSPYCFR